MNKFVIRVDGSEIIGMGHVARCIVLARAILKEDVSAEITFIIKPNQYTESYIKEHGFNVLTLEAKNLEVELEFLLSFIIEHQIDKVILDKFDIDNEYVNKLKIIKAKIIQLYYQEELDLVADLCINPNISKQVIKDDNFYLVGSKYILINDFFIKDIVEVSEHVHNILLTFGAGDKNNITPNILRKLDQYYVLYDELVKPRIHVVIGPVYSNVEEITYVVSQISLEVNLIFNSTNLSKYMKEADLAFAAIGGTIYELISMKVPSIGILQSENQLEVAKILASNNSIINFGYIENLTDKAFNCTLTQMMIKDERRKMINNGLNLVDGKGARRCAKRILRL